jgi:hypothetical protein
MVTGQRFWVLGRAGDLLVPKGNKEPSVDSETDRQKEILKSFGSGLMQNVRDRAIETILMRVLGETQSFRGKTIQEEFAEGGFTKEQIEIIAAMVPEFVDATLHWLLVWLGRSDAVKVMFKPTKGKYVDIKSLSPDDLRSYLNEWIDEFSKQPGKNQRRQEALAKKLIADLLLNYKNKEEDQNKQ